MAEEIREEIATLSSQELNSEGERVFNLEEIFGQIEEAAGNAGREIESDLSRAEALQDQLGESTQPVVEEIKLLRQQVEQEVAGIEARIRRLSSPYVVSPELAEVLEVARFLGRPLLLEGEPGTGKTSLAYALAAHKDLKIIHVQCRSDTTAQNLLYNFDVLKRLQDAQLGKDVSDLRQYISLGPLGQAFASQEQVILLIDEIDKAKRDFPNDLLHELDQMSFFIIETGEEISAKYRPIVIITSNNERDLPEAFLRRCVYMYIDFPSPEQMTEIVKAHIPNVGERLLETAIKRFYEIRALEDLRKKPSTSEMLDWIKVLLKFGVEEIGEETPFLGTLLKFEEDLEKVESQNSLKEKDWKMPAIVTEVLKGKKVIRIKSQAGYHDEPDNAVYVALANNGYNFLTFDYSTRRPFDICESGVKRLDNLTFALPNDSTLYSLLKERDLVASEFKIVSEPAVFAKVKESNRVCIKGKDHEGRILYKTNDGAVIREERFIDQDSYYDIEY